MKIHRLKKKRDFCWPTRGEISEPPGQLRQRPCRQRAYVAFSHTLPGVENRLNTVCAASKVLQSSLFSRPGCLMRPWLRSWRRPPQQLIFDFKTSKPQINISIVDFFTKSAEKPRHSCRGWIGVGRAGLNAQEPNKTYAVPEPSMGEGTA